MISLIKILEKKEQNVEGSVETKLWSGPSLKREYELVLGNDFKVHYGFCVSEFLKNNHNTSAYINGGKEIDTPKNRRKGNGKFLKLNGATGNNLKEVNISIPLGTLCCVTGVSGSGKSSLINNTLYPILNKY